MKSTFSNPVDTTIPDFFLHTWCHPLRWRLHWVHSGEHIGIVGRTGSDKSSLMLSLLWCIVMEGDVYYDDVDVNLDAHHSRSCHGPRTKLLILDEGTFLLFFIP